MKKTFVTAIVLLSIILTGLGQNGKIIDKREFKATNKLIKELNEEFDGANYEDTFAMAKMHELIYESNGYQVKGYMVTPAKSGKYPCIIYNRDGHTDNGLLNEMFVMQELHKMARWGYVVIASQYRGHAGGEGKDEYGGDDVNDVLNLIPLLGDVKRADTTRIGMYGITRGAMMTFIALKHTDKIDAAISQSGIGNLFFYAAEHHEDGMNDVLTKCISEFAIDKLSPIKKRSLVYWADDLNKTTPILLLHGTSDKEVHPTESFEISKQLFRYLHPFRLLMFEGGTQTLSEHQTEKDAAVKKWMNDYVRDGKQFPEIVNLERRPKPKK